MVTPGDVQDRRIATSSRRFWQLRANAFHHSRAPFADGGYQGKLTADEVQQQAGVAGSRRSRRQPIVGGLEGLTKEDLSGEQQALAHAKAALVEPAATEVVSIGRVLFKDGETSGATPVQALRALGSSPRAARWRAAPIGPP